MPTIKEFKDGLYIIKSLRNGPSKKNIFTKTFQLTKRVFIGLNVPNKFRGMKVNIKLINDEKEEVFVIKKKKYINYRGNSDFKVRCRICCEYIFEHGNTKFYKNKICRQCNTNQNKDSDEFYFKNKNI